MNRLRTIRSPISVNLELTLACNLRCGFCFLKSCPRLEHPPLVRLHRIIDELRRAEVFQIRLFGGEPFYYPEWRAVVDYAYRLGFFQMFISNGTLIDKEAIQFLKERKIKSGSVSIHGTKEVHESITECTGSYEQAVEGLELCLSEGWDMTALLTLTQANKEILFETIQALLDRGLRDFFFLASRLAPHGCDQAEWERRRLSFDDYIAVLQELGRIQQELGIVSSLGDPMPYCLVGERYHHLLGGCRSGTSFGYVTGEGEVRGCTVAGGSFGNLLETPLEEIWQGVAMVDYRSLEWLPMKCRRCKSFCGAGCSATRFGVGMYAPDEFLEVGDED